MTQDLAQDGIRHTDKFSAVGHAPACNCTHCVPENTLACGCQSRNIFVNNLGPVLAHKVVKLAKLFGDCIYDDFSAIELTGRVVFAYSDLRDAARAIGSLRVFFQLEPIAIGPAPFKNQVVVTVKWAPQVTWEAICFELSTWYGPILELRRTCNSENDMWLSCIFFDNNIVARPSITVQNVELSVFVQTLDHEQTCQKQELAFLPGVRELTSLFMAAHDPLKKLVAAPSSSWFGNYLQAPEATVRDPTPWDQKNIRGECRESVSENAAEMSEPEEPVKVTKRAVTGLPGFSPGRGANWLGREDTLPRKPFRDISNTVGSTAAEGPKPEQPELQCVPGLPQTVPSVEYLRRRLRNPEQKASVRPRCPSGTPAGDDSDHAPADHDGPTGVPASSKTGFKVNIDDIIRGQDCRDTIMLQNIPNKIDQQSLKKFIDKTHKDRYCFLYLRMDYTNRCNVGYAFICFNSPLDIVSFVEARVGQRWPQHNSNKVIAVTYAKHQGRHALIQKFRNSVVMTKAPEFRPKLYYTKGPHQGEEEPFPEPTSSYQY